MTLTHRHVKRPHSITCFPMFSLFILYILLLASCKKIITIPPPTSTISTSQVFSTYDQATSAIAGIYSQMINTQSINFASGATTIYLGLSADEIESFNTSDQNTFPFQSNTLTAQNALILQYFWTPVYSLIYGANSIIEGLNSSENIEDSVKKELTGEAKFIRAFCYFYLTNLFGDVPIATTIDYNKTAILPRSLSSTVYLQIIKDLEDAKTLLNIDFSAGKGERIIPTKWAASALLSRVYLFTRDWVNAEKEASTIIDNSNNFSLSNDLNSVFLANSNETIWQLKQDNSIYPYNATNEGNTFIPLDSTYNPYTYVTPQLLSSFEIGDERKIKWIKSINYEGITYYYPNKYKIGPAQEQINGPYSEYYTVFRLAEQYLIRAEARSELEESNAADDLNIIRLRSNLPPTTATTQSDLLFAISHERQTELFTEWGHRWLDLKRTKKASSILSIIPYKSSWKDYQQLYPIPIGELIGDPNLSQNIGY